MSATANISAPEVVSSSAAAQTGQFHERFGSISRQSSIYFAGTILTAAAGYFFKIYLARTLGAEALGLYALGMSIVGFLGLFNAIGLPAAAARFVAEYSSQGEYERLGNLLRGGLGLLSAGNCALALGVLAIGPWIAVHLYHAPALTSYFWAFVLIMFFGVLNTFLGQCMAGYRDVMRRTVVTHFIGTPANMCFAVILIGLGFGLTGYLVAQVGSALLVLVLLGAVVWRMTPTQARVASTFRVEREVVAFSATAFGIAAVEFVLAQADKVVLGYYLDPKQVGIYAVAMALVGFVPIALQSVNQIFSPTIAELHSMGNHKLLQQLYATLTKWILVLTIPLAFTVIIFSRTLVGIFGHGFEAGAAVLAIGAVGQLFNCAVGSVGYLLLMSGNQLQLIKIQACNAALMIALSLMLVPRFGITGAAAAAAFTVVTTNLWSLAAVSRNLGLSPYNASYRKIVLPALVSGAALLLLQALMRAQPAWMIAGLAFAVAYAAFLGTFTLMGLNQEDRELAQFVWDRVGANFKRFGD